MSHKEVIIQICYALIRFSGKDLTVILIIFLKQCRSIQSIGALGFTSATVKTILDLTHFGLHLFRQLCCRRCSADHQTHTGTVVDLNSHGTGHAVAAASAEFSYSPLSIASCATFRRWFVMPIWRIMPLSFASSIASYKPVPSPGFGQNAGLWN